MSDVKTILFIVGSLRNQSFNRKLAREMELRLLNRARVEWLEFADVPFLDQDIEYPAPESVSRMRKAVRQADGIWIFTPEYNYQIPGVLKNLLDWLSRPLEENNWKLGSAVRGKPVTISGVAGKSAAAGARKQLSNLLNIMGMKVIDGEGTGIALSPGSFHTGLLPISPLDRAALEEQVEVFLASL